MAEQHGAFGAAVAEKNMRRHKRVHVCFPQSASIQRTRDGREEDAEHLEGKGRQKQEAGDSLAKYDPLGIDLGVDIERSSPHVVVNGGDHGARHQGARTAKVGAPIVGPHGQVGHLTTAATQLQKTECKPCARGDGRVPRRRRMQGCLLRTVVAGAACPFIGGVPTENITRNIPRS